MVEIYDAFYNDPVISTPNRYRKWVRFMPTFYSKRSKVYRFKDFLVATRCPTAEFQRSIKCALDIIEERNATGLRRAVMLALSKHWNKPRVVDYLFNLIDDKPSDNEFARVVYYWEVDRVICRGGVPGYGCGLVDYSGDALHYFGFQGVYSFSLDNCVPTDRFTVQRTAVVDLPDIRADVHTVRNRCNGELILAIAEQYGIYLGDGLFLFDGCYIKVHKDDIGHYWELVGECEG